MPWLSGTASWSHTAMQWILGIRPEIDGLRIDPCIPKPGRDSPCAATSAANVKIEVKNPRGSQGASRA